MSKLYFTPQPLSADHDRPLPVSQEPSLLQPYGNDALQEAIREEQAREHTERRGALAGAGKVGKVIGSAAGTMGKIGDGAESVRWANTRLLRTADALNERKSPLKTGSKLLSGASRLTQAVFDDKSSALDRVAMGARGSLEVARGLGLSGHKWVDGLLKGGDALADSQNKDGFGVMDALDFSEGLMATGGELAGFSLAEAGSLSVSEAFAGQAAGAGTLGSAAAVLGSGVAGYKLGGLIEKNITIDDELAKLVGSHVDVNGLAGGGWAEAAAKMAADGMDLQAAVDTTFAGDPGGAGALARMTASGPGAFMVDLAEATQELFGSPLASAAKLAGS